jgi:hypothetical protein
VRHDAAVQETGQAAGERDSVALDGDVDVEALFPQQEVANGAADEIRTVWAR